MRRWKVAGGSPLNETHDRLHSLLKVSESDIRQVLRTHTAGSCWGSEMGEIRYIIADLKLPKSAV